MLERWRENLEKHGVRAALDAVLPGGLVVQALYGAPPAESAAPLRLCRAGGIELATVLIAGDACRGQAELVWELGEAPTATSAAGIVEWREGGVTHVARADRRAVHALDAHDQGASIPVELGLAIARWLDALRAGVEDPPLAVAVGPELFVEAAKLRALRALAERARAALTGHAAPVRILSRTSLVSASRIEPETNALRSALAAVAGLIGGADLVAVAPYDLLSPLAPAAHAEAVRLATTTSLVATLESHLVATDDPLHGAYFVETLTAQMVEAAWARTRALEAAGGAARAEPSWRAWIDDDTRAREKAAVTGKLARVGASKLARPEAPSLGRVHPALTHVVRDAAPFEALRDEGIGAETSVIVAGDAAKLAARVAYVRELLGVWGATPAVESSPTIEAALEAALARGASPARAILCVEDADLGRAAPLVAALATRARTMIAGRPGPHEAALRASGAVGFVHLGADLVAAARALYVGASGEGP